MKHKQYEKWILDETPLDANQKAALESHLRSCAECRALHTGWAASKQLIAQAALQQPSPGFSFRWQQTVVRKHQGEKIRRYRLSLFSLVLLAFVGIVVYMIVTDSVMRSFANGIAILSGIIIKITNGLSSIGYWLNRLPIAVPVTIAFAFFGLFSAFMMAGGFFLWNLTQRRPQTHEIKTH